MTVDLYTKVVLSVIAACLVWLCVNGSIPVASAQAQATRPTPVVLVDERGAPLMGPQGLRVNAGGQPVPVMVGNDTLPVTLVAVARKGTWDPIQVEVMRTAPTALPGP